MTHDELIALAEAARDGKEIQCQLSNGCWEILRDPSADNICTQIKWHVRLRVKPEPKVFFKCFDDHGYAFGYPYDDLNDAKASLVRSPTKLSVYRCEEVL